MEDQELTQPRRVAAPGGASTVRSATNWSKLVRADDCEFVVVNELIRHLSRPAATSSDPSDSVVVMGQSNRITLVVLFLSLITLFGCQDLAPRDTQSLFFPGLQRSEIFGFLAGMGTTFAAVPDLVSMLKRRSRAGMYPMMAAIMGTFQILWVYYGILIASRPVIAWNVVAVLINFLTVGAYAYFGYKEKSK